MYDGQDLMCLIETYHENRRLEKENEKKTRVSSFQIFGISLNQFCFFFFFNDKFFQKYEFVMHSMKRDLKSANVNFEIIEYVVGFDKHLKKKSRRKRAKMGELGYFEIGSKKYCILRKTILKFMDLIFGIFEKKFILKHFMHRTIPKRCILGVF